MAQYELSVVPSSTDERSVVSESGNVNVNGSGAPVDSPQVNDHKLTNDFPESLALLRPPNEAGDRTDDDILEVIRSGFRHRQLISSDGVNNPAYIRVVPQDMRELIEVKMEEQLHTCTKDEKDEFLRKVLFNINILNTFQIE